MRSERRHSMREEHMRTKILISALALVCLAMAALFFSFAITTQEYTWTERYNINGTGDWRSIASSGNGTILVAAPFNGYICTSSDSGVTWKAQTGSGARRWSSIASSSDGTKLAACNYYGIYTSTDWGATWTAQQADSGDHLWNSITSSTNGRKLGTTATN